MPTKLQFDAERWLRNVAEVQSHRAGAGPAMLRENMLKCADEIHRLRMADDLNQQGAELMREEVANVKAELAALKDAARPIAKFWKGGGVRGVVRGTNPPLEEKYLDALAALVGEEGR